MNTRSPKFGDRVPTGMLMQCIEYGTEFRQGTRTISKAITQIKPQVTQVVQDRIDQEIQKLDI